jgi:very-short-patch-repair endonuclease
MIAVPAFARAATVSPPPLWGRVWEDAATMPNYVPPKQRDNARRLRRDMTGCEKRVWAGLKAHRSGAHFRRQAPIGPYIADFLCKPAGLVVEIDGDQHSWGRQAATDQKRNAWLAEHGYRTLRFSNWQVMNEFESVMLTIEAAVQNALDPSAYAALPVVGSELLTGKGEGTNSLSRNGGEMERGPALQSTSVGSAPSQPSPVPGEGSRALPGQGPRDDRGQPQ